MSGALAAGTGIATAGASRSVSTTSAVCACRARLGATPRSRNSELPKPPKPAIPPDKSLNKAATCGSGAGRIAADLPANSKAAYATVEPTSKATVTQIHKAHSAPASNDCMSKIPSNSVPNQGQGKSRSQCKPSNEAGCSATATTSNKRLITAAQKEAIKTIYPALIQTLARSCRARVRPDEPALEQSPKLRFRHLPNHRQSPPDCGGCA